MHFNWIELYLMAINLVAFLSLGILFLVAKHRRRPLQPGVFSLILLFAGGSLGSLLGSLLWCRRPTGDYESGKQQRDSFLSWRVLTVLLLILHLLIWLLVLGGLPLSDTAWQTAADFLHRNWKIFGGYFAAMNLTAFAAFGLDKRQARRQGRRISIRTLFVLAALGGAAGALAGMLLFRHKTGKLYFKLGLPLILVIHLLIYFSILIHSLI